MLMTLLLRLVHSLNFSKEADASDAVLPNAGTATSNSPVGDAAIRASLPFNKAQQQRSFHTLATAPSLTGGISTKYVHRFSMNHSAKGLRNVDK